MQEIILEIHPIPHGHGLSFKRGISDGLLDLNVHENEPHETHKASYQRGKELGINLKSEIARHVKK